MRLCPGAGVDRSDSRGLVVFGAGNAPISISRLKAGLNIGLFRWGWNPQSAGCGSGYYSWSSAKSRIASAW